jgi:hypothetical protein
LPFRVILRQDCESRVLWKFGYGYDEKSIADEFHIKPADVRLFLHGQLDLARSRELTEQMLVVGLPV